jgi:hypothetical protein
VRIGNIVPEFVVSFPKELEPGVLYVSAQFSTAAHLCACGCGREVVTPLSQAQWVLILDGSVSLRPSIGNWALPCQSHYLIDHGTIRWSKSFTRAEVDANRKSDDRRLNEGKHASKDWPRFVRRR